MYNSCENESWSLWSFFKLMFLRQSRLTASDHVNANNVQDQMKTTLSGWVWDSSSSVQLSDLIKYLRQY